MRSTWPSWVLVALGAVMLLGGLWAFSSVGGSFDSASSQNAILVLPALLGGAILLAAGLNALQRSYDACCGWGGGCDCCGDDCSCGDCGDCRDGCDCCNKDCKCGDCGSCQGSQNGKQAEPVHAH